MNNKIVGTWLLIGVFMVFVQVIIGGVTRLTGSGLSITKWEIVTGTIPPLSVQQWTDEFDLYKATPQYKKINEGMTLQSFKFIYFWEYFHRLWARTMGFVFIFPFIFFLFKRLISFNLLIKLLIVILMASVVAGFGWIMVQSGLINKPWVSPLKLTIHLSLAIILFIYLIVVSLEVLLPPIRHFDISGRIKSVIPFLILAMAFQILLGGMMSGMKAGVNFPTFPRMNGEWIPTGLISEEWSLDSFINYDSSLFAVSFVQFFHRLFAMLVLILSTILAIDLFKSAKTVLAKNSSLSLLIAVVLQFSLGVITVLSCKGQIPVFWGVMHQAFALILIGSLVINLYLLKTSITKQSLR